MRPVLLSAGFFASLLGNIFACLFGVVTFPLMVVWFLGMALTEATVGTVMFGYDPERLRSDFEQAGTHIALSFGAALTLPLSIVTAVSATGTLLLASLARRLDAAMSAHLDQASKTAHRQKNFWR